LDLTLQTLSLTFDETVLASSLNVEELVLQATSDISEDTELYHRLGDESLTLSEDNTILVVTLSLEDLNEIKRKDHLATESSNTFLSFGSSAVVDMNVAPNNVVAVSDNDGIRVTSYVVDSISPVLDSFALDLTAETLTLFFSETVRSSTLDVTQLRIQNNVSSADMWQTTTYRQLTGEVGVSGDLFALVVDLTDADLNYIKRVRSLATNGENTFISLSSDAVEDMAGNNVVAIDSTNAQRTVGFDEDVTAPELVAFSLNMDSGVLSLTFSETIKGVDSLVIDELQIQASETAAGGEFYVPLHDVTPASTADDVVFNVHFGVEDLNEIKRLSELATSTSNTFLTFSEAAISDMNDNAVVARVDGDAIQASAFVEDTTSPNLVSFDLDLTSEVLTLTFDETVRASSLDVSEILVQGSRVLQNDVESFELRTVSSDVLGVLGHVDICDDSVTELSGSLELFMKVKADMRTTKIARH